MTILAPHKMHPSRTESSVLQDNYGASEESSLTVTGDLSKCCNRKTNSGSMDTSTGALDNGNLLKASALPCSLVPRNVIVYS